MVGSAISHYKIVAKLGEGGMGVVYKAEDTKLERTVALKFIAQHLLDDDEAKERFLREVKAAAALDHPNICTVHEIDEVDGKTFIAMAYVDGTELTKRIEPDPLSIDNLLDTAIQERKGTASFCTESAFRTRISPLYLPSVNALRSHGEKRSCPLGTLGTVPSARPRHAVTKASYASRSVTPRQGRASAQSAQRLYTGSSATDGGQP